MTKSDDGLMTADRIIPSKQIFKKIYIFVQIDKLSHCRS